MNHLPEFYKQKGIRYIFDPSQQIPVLKSEELLKAITGSYMLIVNDYELEMISNATQKSQQELAGMTGLPGSDPWGKRFAHYGKRLGYPRRHCPAQ